MSPSKSPVRVSRRWAVAGVLVLSMALLLGALPGVYAVDTEKPYVKSFTPKDGVSNVEIDSVIIIDFSEDIRSSNLDSHITMKDGRGFQVDKQVDYSNMTFRAIVTPLEPLKYSMLYVVSVSAFILDLSGNHLREPVQWTFNTTKEKTPPEVVITTPTDKTGDVSINATIKVVFSEEMNVESLRTGLVVHDTYENPVIGNITAAVDGLSFTFVPLFSYGYGESYKVTVLKTVKDLAGNTMVTDHVFGFTVQLEQIQPRVVSIWPVDQSQFVKRTTRVWVTFSEPMNSTSLAGTVIIQDPDLIEISTTPQYNADNYTLMVKPDQPLDYQTLFTITVKQDAKDLAGNFLDKVYSSTFTTEKIPQQPPNILTRTPRDDEFNWFEGISITFTIEADDPNDDILVYAWEVNGDPREGETFNEYVFYPETGSEGSYKVEVAVMDGITAPVTHYWIVNVVRSTPDDNGDPITPAFNRTYLLIILILVIIFGLVVYGYTQLMDRKREILSRTRRRLRPLTFKRTTVVEKPPTYEEMYLRPDSVYAKKSPEFKPVAPPGGATVKGRVTAEATVTTVMGSAPELIPAKEVVVRSAEGGPYTTDAPELKKKRPPGVRVCPKCGQKAIEAAHGRLWCDTCGFIE